MPKEIVFMFLELSTMPDGWLKPYIYIKDIFIREEFALRSEEMVGIKDICIFLTDLYIEVWLVLQFLKKLRIRI